jgi:hypothetical protein
MAAGPRVRTRVSRHAFRRGLPRASCPKATPLGRHRLAPTLAQFCAMVLSHESTRVFDSSQFGVGISGGDTRPSQAAAPARGLSPRQRAVAMVAMGVMFPRPPKTAGREWRGSISNRTESLPRSPPSPPIIGRCDDATCHAKSNGKLKEEPRPSPTRRPTRGRGCRATVAALSVASPH